MGALLIYRGPGKGTESVHAKAYRLRKYSCRRFIKLMGRIA